MGDINLEEVEKAFEELGCTKKCCRVFHMTGGWHKTNCPLHTDNLINKVKDLEQQLAELRDSKTRLLAYEKHYGVMTGAAVSLILTGTLPFAEFPKEQRDSKSLLRKVGNLPKGCYCQPGRCSAPQPKWCRDHKKRDMEQGK